MLCDDCGENEAILHVTSIENNQLKSSHLCESCATARGYEQTQLGSGNVPLTDFLAQMGRVGDASQVGSACPYCGLKIEEFKKSGRLGCSQCFVAFEPHLRPLLRRLHGGTQHTGKVYLPPNPSVAQREERLAGLRRKLSKAVESEDFERAAQIRDLIKSLEGAA
jgi:protein arginine kinase activator